MLSAPHLMSRFVTRSSLPFVTRPSAREERTGSPAPKKRSNVTKRRATTKARTSKPIREDWRQGWEALQKPENSRVLKAPRANPVLQSVSTKRFGLLVLLIAALFTLYIGHIHATQDLLSALEQTRRENLQLHLTYNRLKGEFDRVTGPAVIYERATALGLEEGITYGPTITLDP